MTRFGAGIPSALALVSAMIHAETPLARYVVRSVPLSGWSVSCFGTDAATERCLAKRRYRALLVEIEGGSDSATVAVSGGCRAHADRVEARREWGSTRTSKETAAVGAMAEALVAFRLRQCDDLPARGGFLRSLRGAAVRVGEITRAPA